jgi:cytochrome c oxidase cbb3-type subunit 3
MNRENKPENDTLIAGDHDGIREYDNDLPTWWVLLFLLTIALGAIYVFWMHLAGGYQPEAYKAELTAIKKSAVLNEAAQKGKGGEVDLLELIGDKAVNERGRQVFDSRCAACHGKAGEGMIGPNLTDDYWLHGGQISDLNRVVENGVLEKGMLAWKGMLTPEELHAVVVFVWNLHGSNPPNGKAPQGEIVSR